jgi:hypothetical protein
VFEKESNTSGAATVTPLKKIVDGELNWRITYRNTRDMELFPVTTCLLFRLYNITDVIPVNAIVRSTEVVAE